MELAIKRRMTSEWTYREHRGPDRGFSMVELMVVVMIIVAVAAFSVPAISQYLRNYTIKGATQQVAGEIQAARGQAIKRNVNNGVVFAVLSDTDYQFFIEDNPFHRGLDPTQPSFVDVNDPDRAPGSRFESLSGNRRTLPTGLQFRVAGGTDCAIRFDRMGRLCRPESPASNPMDCVPDVVDGTNCPGDKYIAVPDGGGGATVAIDQPKTGLSRTIQVTSGGRVLAQP